MSPSDRACRSSPPSRCGERHGRQDGGGRGVPIGKAPRRSQPVADRLRGGAGDLHGGARHHHRQRSPAVHLGRPRGRARRGGLGRDQLPRGECHHADGVELPGQALRKQGVLHVVGRAVHSVVDPVRLRLEPGIPTPVPGPPGARRRRHGSPGAVDPGGFLPAREARPGVRDLRRRHRGRAGDRADSRRLALRQRLLALVLPDQRPGGRHRPGADVLADRG